MTKRDCSFYCPIDFTFSLFDMKVAKRLFILLLTESRDCTERMIFFPVGNVSQGVQAVLLQLRTKVPLASCLGCVMKITINHSINGT